MTIFYEKFIAGMLSLLITGFLINAGPALGMQSNGWELTITVEDDDENSVNLVIGTSETATESFDPALDQYAPPAAPAGSFDARITDGNEDYFKSILPLTTQLSSWTFLFRSAEPDEDISVTVTWNNEELENETGLFFLTYQNGSESVQTDMKAEQQVVLPDDTEEVEVNHIVQGSSPGNYSAGWQLVGNPTEISGTDPFDLFENALPGTFFGYEDVYYEANEFTAGTGYWLRLSEAEEITIEPPFLNSVTLNVEPGWHLISGPGQPVALNDIEDPDSLIVSDNLQGYDEGYVDADTLRPGRGYWILTQGTGSITIHSDFSLLAKQVPEQLSEPEGFVTYTVSNEGNRPLTFYIGGSLGEQDINPLSFSLPPLPPDDAFDIRYENGSRLIEDIIGNLLVHSPGDSLLFTYPEQDANDVLEFDVKRAEQEQTEIHTLLQGEELLLESEEITEIGVSLGVVNPLESSGEIPGRIALDQNYPNPFNPSTVIEYHLPEMSDVQIQVFDVTGRSVGVLVEGTKSAGSHQVRFDASSLSSGIYMYRLNTAGRILTRKMTLIK